MRGGAYLLVATLAAGVASARGAGSSDRVDGRRQGGVGVYTFQDSNGNRYEGVYDFDPQDISNFAYAPNYQQFIPDFAQDFIPKFPFSQNFMDPSYYINLGQQYAQAGMQFGQQFIPTFRRSGYHGQAGANHGQAGANHGHAGANQGYAGVNPEGIRIGQRSGDSGDDTDNFQHSTGDGAGGVNFAFAGGFVGPDGVRQVASISPSNPNKPNVDVKTPGSGRKDGGGVYSVSSSSFASSSNVNGKKTESRGARTVVNDNGKVTEYEIKN